MRLLPSALSVKDTGIWLRLAAITTPRTVQAKEVRAAKAKEAKAKEEKAKALKGGRALTSRGRAPAIRATTTKPTP